MTPTDQVAAIAEVVRGVIAETSEAHLREDPEDAYVDLACRLVLALGARGLTFAPTTETVQDRIRRDQAAAALRIFESISAWVRTPSTIDQMRGFSVMRGDKTPVELYVSVGEKTRAFFTGETVQDACAQLAQTLTCNEGDLEGPVDAEA